MVTVSHLVKKIVKDKPFLQEALTQKIISYGNLAEQILPKIERELEKKIKHSAVVMALRRYADELEKNKGMPSSFDYNSELVMKTNICDFTVVKSKGLLAKLKSLYSLVDFARGDILNIILGNQEVSIVISEKYKDKLTKFLKGEKILHKEFGLTALSINFKSSDFMHTPGVIFTIIRKLAWENINIFEIISTKTELALILKQKDSVKAYESLQELISAKGNFVVG